MGVVCRSIKGSRRGRSPFTTGRPRPVALGYYTVNRVGLANRSLYYGAGQADRESKYRSAVLRRVRIGVVRPLRRRRARREAIEEIVRGFVDGGHRRENSQ